jgi:hypothetical protein
MKRASSLLLILLVAMILAACDTLDTAQDESAAQQFQPNLAGFERSNADSVTDAIARIGAGTSLATGNAPGAAALARMEQVLQCFQDVGAIDVSVYTQQDSTEMIPNTGVSMVLNQTRMNRNLINCLANPDGAFSAQALDIQPCAQSGNFTYQEENFAYAYIGVGNTICTEFSSHFAQYNPEVNP